MVINMREIGAMIRRMEKVCYIFKFRKIGVWKWRYIHRRVKG
jgi:hypothetical protein